MKKFVFRLDALLRVKKSRIKLLQKELGSSRKKWECLQEEENSLKNEIEKAEEEIRQIRLRGDFLAEQNYEHFLNHFKERHSKLKIHLEKQRCEFFLKQTEVSEAIQERKIIEKIQEKQYIQWQHQNENLSEEEHVYHGFHPE